MKSPYGMSSDSYRTYNMLHAAATLVLAASLVLLPWLTNIGPNTWRTCSPEANAVAPQQQVATPLPEESSVAKLDSLPPAQESTQQESAPEAATPTAPPDTPIMSTSSFISQSATPAATEPAPQAAPTAEASSNDLPTARIYFDVNQQSLPANGAIKILPVVEYLKANHDAKVSISGFHDGQGNQAYNDRLAHNRALSVQKQLTSSGIEANRITLVKPQQATGEGSQNEARRVELTIQPN